MDILKINSMDALKIKEKHFLFLNEVLHTSAKPSSTTEKNKKIMTFGNIRKLLCSLTELSSSNKGFFVPYNWEKFGGYFEFFAYLKFS